MTEDLLHFIWKNQLFDKSQLTTLSGEDLEIIDPGKHNHDAGPDFSFARVRIGKVRWAGQLELHIRSDDWIKHRHSKDPAYRNVILHVVWEQKGIVVHDPILCKIPVLELKGRVAKSVLSKYESIYSRKSSFPCKNLWSELDPFKLEMWIERMLADRLEDRVSWYEKEVGKSNGDWESVLHTRILQGLGGKVNALAFYQLALLLPLSLVRKYSDQRLALEALVFGRAGFLQGDQEDDYLKELRLRYDHLRNKHRLEDHVYPLWRFGRMRPGNFPTVRMIQWIDLLMHTKGRWNNKWEFSPIEQERPTYWQNHIIPGRLSKMGVPVLSPMTIENLQRNVLIPFRMAYRRRVRHSDLGSLLEWFAHLPPENDIVIRGFNGLPLDIAHSGYTQGLHQLKSNYCDQLKCTSCAIGRQFLSSKL